MSFKISKKKIITHKNKYVVEQNWMHGDCSAYTIGEVVFDTRADKKLIKETLSFIAALKSIDDQFIDPFCEAAEDILENYPLLKQEKLDNDWDTYTYLTHHLNAQLNCLNNFNGFCMLESVKLFYYDKNGNKFKVAIK